MYSYIKHCPRTLPPRWFAVLLGQGHLPSDYNPLIDSIDAGENLANLRRIKSEIRATAAKLPTHESFLD
jgi:tryptophan halogenase